MSLLERDAFGEWVVVEVEARIALARCRRCEARLRVLPSDVLPYKHYSWPVIEWLTSQYTAAGWPLSLRAVAWEQLGERTPAHTTLHGWTEGLGAHALEWPGAAPWGVAFARTLYLAYAREPSLLAVWQAERVVCPTRYRSPPRAERLSALARVLAVGRQLTRLHPPESLVRWRALLVLDAAEFGLCFPSQLPSTRIEHVLDPSQRSSPSRDPPSAP